MEARSYREPTKVYSEEFKQGTSKAYRMKLKELGAIQSMSRKANCYDNACAESFFAVFKTCCFAQDRRELLLHHLDSTDVYFRIEEWIRKYNVERLQEDLDWKSPVYYKFLSKWAFFGFALLQSKGNGLKLRSVSKIWDSSHTSKTSYTTHTTHTSHTSHTFHTS